MTTIVSLLGNEIKRYKRYGKVGYHPSVSMEIVPGQRLHSRPSDRQTNSERENHGFIDTFFRFHKRVINAALGQQQKNENTNVKIST